MVEVCNKQVPHGALEGVKVLECGNFVSAAYCSKLLADLGAEVIKIEKPGTGDKARRRGPYPGDRPHRERSGLFLFLNTNKTGITLDLETITGRKIFQDLIRGADVLVENYPAGRMEQLGLHYEALAATNERLVMTSITPFGQTGPHSRFKAYYLNTFHAGGEGYTLPGGASWEMHSDQPPIKTGGFVGECNSGYTAAIATLAAVYMSEVTGCGEHIDISQQEALLSLMRVDLAKYNDGWVESRATRSMPVGGLVPCKDGFVHLAPLFANMWEGLVELMGNPDWAHEERFQHKTLWGGFQGVSAVSAEVMRDREEANDLLARWALQHTRDEIYHGAQARGCIAAPVYSPAEVATSEALESRGFFVEIGHEEAGLLKYPGAPCKFSKTPWRLKRPAPLLGEHNEEVYCKRLGYAREDLVELYRAGVI